MLTYRWVFIHMNPNAIFYLDREMNVTMMTITTAYWTMMTTADWLPTQTKRTQTVSIMSRGGGYMLCVAAVWLLSGVVVFQRTELEMRAKETLTKTVSLT